MSTHGSLLRRRAAEALRHARRLPVGTERNDFRQLAIGLLWLDRKGMAHKFEERAAIAVEREAESRVDDATKKSGLD